MYGQLNFATRLGATSQNRIIPLGVEGGTRSRAAERMITYRTADSLKYVLVCEQLMLLTIIDQTEKKEGEIKAEEIPPLP